MLIITFHHFSTSKLPSICWSMSTPRHTPEVQEYDKKCGAVRNFLQPKSMPKKPSWSSRSTNCFRFSWFGTFLRVGGWLEGVGMPCALAQKWDSNGTTILIFVFAIIRRSGFGLCATSLSVNSKNESFEQRSTRLLIMAVVISQLSVPNSSWWHNFG